MKVVGDYLHEARVVVDLAVSSRKRLFQHLAKMLAVEDDDAENNPRNLDTVLHTLTRRENSAAPVGRRHRPAARTNRRPRRAAAGGRPVARSD